MVVIGLDAMTWDAAKPLMAAGRLPNLKRIVDEGASGVLLSQNPTFSSCIWTTIATGVRREKHGIVHLAIPGTDPPVPYTSNMRKRKAIWNILSDRKRTVGVVNWWITYPAEPVNGYMVSSYWRYYYARMLAEKGTSSSIIPEVKGAAYPETLAKELMETRVRPVEQAMAIDFPAIERYQVNGIYDPSFGMPLERNPFFFKKMMEQDEFIRTVGLKLCKEQPVDFFAVYFENIDAACHLFWKFSHPNGTVLPPQIVHDLGPIVDSVYEYSDGILGDYMKLLDSKTVLIVCSDHGYGYGEPSPDQHYHKLNGVIAFFGEPVRKGLHLSQMSVADVTPTILNIMGLPAANDMDGKAVTDFLEKPYRGAVPQETISTYEVEGDSSKVDRTPAVSPVDGELIKQLKALGYLK